MNKDYFKNTLYNDSPINVDIRKKLVNDLKYVSIDSVKSFDYLNKLRKDNEITKEKYFKNYYSVCGIRDNNLYFIFDDYGRVHTNFTVLKKEIRKNNLMAALAAGAHKLLKQVLLLAAFRPLFMAADHKPGK